MDPNPESSCEPADSVISGLVVTLSNNTESSAGALTEIKAHPAIQVGSRQERWLPVAIEASDRRQCQQLHDWIASRPGVEHVDVVAISFDSAEDALTNGLA